MVKSYPWTELRKMQAGSEELFGEPPQADKVYGVNLATMPRAFRQQLVADGFELNKVTTAAIVMHEEEGYSVRIEQ
jgi:hypothetical protein